MNDTPGWTPPGAAPSGGDGEGAPRPDGSTDRPAPHTGPASKWSKDQPPAGGWSAPGTGGQPGPPQGGAPQHPGWGTPPPPGPGWGGWQAQPQFAKPGVIPLRPLGVGEILDGTVTMMRTYWRTVLGISLTVAVVTQLTLVLVQGTLLKDLDSSALDDPGASADEIGESLVAALTGGGAALAVTLLGTIVATALLTTVTSRAVLGRPVSIREAWIDARPRLLRLLGLTLLLMLIPMLIMAVGLAPGFLIGLSGNDGLVVTVFGMLAALVVVVWLMFRLWLASPALMLEKQGIRKAMGRSMKLVRGSWWRVLGITLLAGLITNIVAFLVLIPFTIVAAIAGGDVDSGLLTTTGASWTFLIVTGIGSVIASTLTFPVSAGVTVLLYIDQRIRREGLDLELARAADTTTPATDHRPPGS
ncbi:DUF7544 domain-containing protein [Streptomyces sp. LE64]|uniref:DUF7544 domain-containing protein n=1 Tax=Streptomyces sp. LE64 TaxID=3448653 RepID=UPI004042EB82